MKRDLSLPLEANGKVIYEKEAHVISDTITAITYT